MIKTDRRKDSEEKAMEEKKDQGLHAEAAGKLPEEALDQVAGGLNDPQEFQQPVRKESAS